MSECLCPVCDYPFLEEAPWADDGAASDEMCPSCGTQFGYDDATGGDVIARGIRHLELRDRWKAGGMKWFSVGIKPPPGWDSGTKGQFL